MTALGTKEEKAASDWKQAFILAGLGVCVAVVEFSGWGSGAGLVLGAAIGSALGAIHNEKEARNGK